MKVSSKKQNGWVPTSLGLFPEDMERVQVTYLSYIDGKPLCDAVAHRERGDWRWSFDYTIPEVKITAWKHLCEPYRPKQRIKVKVERRKRNELRKDKK